MSTLPALLNQEHRRHRRYVVCRPIAPKVAAPKGAVTGNCRNCNKSVILSAQTRERMVKTQAVYQSLALHPVCTVCAGTYRQKFFAMDKEGRVTVPYPPHDQLGEFAALYHQEYRSVPSLQDLLNKLVLAIDRIWGKDEWSWQVPGEQSQGVEGGPPGNYITV